MKKRYECVFTGLYNYILTKDVGMIPYTLSNDYSTSITTYNNDNYDYIKNELDNRLQLNFIHNSGSEKKDVINYLRKNSKNIDILQLYHLRYYNTFWYTLIYKLYNKNGHLYLKLDANKDYVNFLVKRKGIKPTIRRFIVKILFKFIDTVSTETLENYKTLKESNIVDKNKLIYIPNGIRRSTIPLNNKEKRILYVGDIDKHKSIDVLLNVLKEIQLGDWKVILIGSIKEDMKEFIEEYFKDNPELKNKIILKGYISDKQELSKEYANSSIYCCMSKNESFGISTLEAAYNGLYIISTPVGASQDIINKTSYGKIIEHDPTILKKELEKTMNNWDIIEENPYKIKEIIEEEFLWSKICEKLKERFDEKN